MNHTPEPWITSPLTDPESLHAIWHEADDSALDVMIARTCYAPASEANADRIVSCVNACTTLNPEALPEVIAALRLLIAEHDASGYIGIGSAVMENVKSAFIKATL